MTALAVVMLAGTSAVAAPGQRGEREWSGDRPQRDWGGGRSAPSAPRASEAPSAPAAAQAPEPASPRGASGWRGRNVVQDSGRAPAPTAPAAPQGAQPATPQGASGWRGRNVVQEDGRGRGDGHRSGDHRDRDGDRDRHDGGRDRGGDDRRDWGRHDDGRDWGRRDDDRRNWGRRDDDRRDWRRHDDDRSDWGRNDRDGRRHWTRGRYPSVYFSSHRYHHRWRPPPGFYVRFWSYGDYLPRSWYGPDWWLIDPWTYDLPLPPPGYDWVRVGDDALLVDRYTGRIIQVVRDVFW